MTVSFASAGTPTSATGSATAPAPAFPATVNAGQKALLFVNIKPYDSTCDTPSGWTLVDNDTNGSTASGNNTGSTAGYVFERDCDGSEDGSTVTLTINGSPSSAGAVIHLFDKTDGSWDTTVIDWGDKVGNSANMSMTCSTNTSIAAGDLVAIFFSINASLGTPSADTCTQTGVTFGTVDNRSDRAITTGQDSRNRVNTVPVNSVTTPSGGATVGYTNASSTSGLAATVRLRHTSGTDATVTPTVVARSGVVETFVPSAGATHAPSVIARSGVVEAFVPSAGATHAPTVVARSATAPAATLSAGAGATITPTVVARTVVVDAPTVVAPVSATVTPTVVARSVVIGSSNIDQGVVVRATATGQTSSNNTTVSIVIPATAQIDDIAYLLVNAVNSGGTFSIPAGWNSFGQVANNVNVTTSRIFRKKIKSGDPGATVNVVHSLAKAMTASMIVVDGVDGTEEATATINAPGPASTNHTANTLTTVNNDALSIVFYTSRGSTVGDVDAVWTAPSGYTEAITSHSTHGAANNARAAIYYKAIPTAATATGSVTATVDTSSIYIGHHIALKAGVPDTGEILTPNPVDRAVTIPASTNSAQVVITGTVVARTVVVDAPTVLEGGNATVTTTVVARSVVTPAATVSVSHTVAPSTVSVAATTPAATVDQGGESAFVTPGTVFAVASIGNLQPFIRSTSSAFTTTLSTQLNIDIPNGVKEGDVGYLLVNATNSSGTWATPDGWTDFGQGNNNTNITTSKIFKKVFVGTEGGNVVATVHSLSKALAASMIVVAGTDGSEEATAVINAPPSSSTNMTANSATSVNNNALSVVFYTSRSASGDTSAVWTAPTNYTEAVLTHSTHTAAPNSRNGIFSRNIPTAGTVTGAVIASIDSASFYNAHHLIIKYGAIGVDIGVAPAEVARTVTIPSATLSATALAIPDVVPIVATIGDQVTVAEEGLEVTTVARSVTFPAAGITAGVKVTPTVLARALTVPTFTVSAQSITSATPATVARLVTIGTPFVDDSTPDILRQTFDNGAEGTQVTAFNSATSGEPLASIGFSGAATITYKAAAAMRGPMGAHVVATAGETLVATINAQNAVATPVISAQMLYKPLAHPTTNNTHILRHVFGTTAAMRVVHTTLGYIQLQSAASSNVFTGTTQMVLGEEYLINLYAEIGTTTANGKVTLEVYDSNDNLIDSYTSTTANTGTTNYTGIQFGKIVSTAVGFSSYFDTVGIQSLYAAIPLPPLSSSATIPAATVARTVTIPAPAVDDSSVRNETVKPNTLKRKAYVNVPNLVITTVTGGGGTDDLGKTIGGVWLLQQTAGTTSYLSNMRTGISRVPSMVGFGFRVPASDLVDASGNVITTSTGRLATFVSWVQTIRAENPGKDIRMSFRPIFGQYTPAAWKTPMPAQLQFTDGGVSGIHPCYTAAITHTHDGLASHSHAIGDANDMFEIRFRTFFRQIVTYLNNNGLLGKDLLVPFIHGGYYALNYSEYYYGPPCQAASYSGQQHVDAHLRLTDILKEELPVDVAAEWATTGHGPMVGNWATGSGSGSNTFIDDLTDHLLSSYGSGSDRIYISYNGWHDLQIGGGGSAADEYNKQYASRQRPAILTPTRRGIRAELQDILRSTTDNFSWDLAFGWADPASANVTQATDTLPAYSGANPPRRTLGEGSGSGGANEYMTRGAFPLEIYLARVVGTGGAATNWAQIEPRAAAFRNHILSLYTGGGTITVRQVGLHPPTVYREVRIGQPTIVAPSQPATGATVTTTTVGSTAAVPASTPSASSAKYWATLRAGIDSFGIGSPIKRFAPMFNKQTYFDVSTFTNADDMTQEDWDTVAQYYGGGHWEGHNWSTLLDNDGSTGPRKFLKSKPDAEATIYVNGSYVTQGTPWFNWRVAAHLERHYPLGIATLDTTSGSTLSAQLTASATTITINLPTAAQRPTGLPANHPNGTPSAFWPLIGSTLVPSNTTYSRNTAEYVFWIRIDNEIIGLPLYNAGTWTAGTNQVTIAGVVRGLWGTVPAVHTATTKVRVPVHIGSAAADAADAALSGNPQANVTTSGLRYGINFWDAAFGGIGAIADTAGMELLGLKLDAPATVSSVSGNTFTTAAIHGFANGSRVALGGYNIPLGAKALTRYFVTNATSNTFQLIDAVTSNILQVADSASLNCIVGAILGTAGEPIVKGVWWDVSSALTYNNADAYGNDMVNSTAIVDLPYDFTNQAFTNWGDRQAAKRAALDAILTSRGFPKLTMHANNYKAQVGQMALGERMTLMSAKAYDRYSLEFFSQESALMTTDFTQLFQLMRGVNGANTVVNPDGNPGGIWAKSYTGTVKTDTVMNFHLDYPRYLRFIYGQWLMTWREGATQPRMIISQIASVLTRPSDRAGREIFFWNFGVPIAQFGGAPVNADTAAQLHSPSANVYTRRYSHGTVVLNMSGTPYNFVADRDYYDANTETGGSGNLTLRFAQDSITIPAYDAVFLLNAHVVRITPLDQVLPETVTGFASIGTPQILIGSLFTARPQTVARTVVIGAPVPLESTLIPPGVVARSVVIPTATYFAGTMAEILASTVSALASVSTGVQSVSGGTVDFFGWGIPL